MRELIIDSDTVFKDVCKLYRYIFFDQVHYVWKTESSTRYILRLDYSL